jgi:hypothetical protein
MVLGGVTAQDDALSTSPLHGSVVLAHDSAKVSNTSTEITAGGS